jgi:hypothetical protein
LVSEKQHAGGRAWAPIGLSHVSNRVVTRQFAPQTGAKICTTDAGYAGAGIHTTAQAGYSEAYARDDDGEHVMLLCWVAVGLIVPDFARHCFAPGAPYEARGAFYDQGGNVQALKSTFDSHLSCITQPISARRSASAP